MGRKKKLRKLSTGELYYWQNNPNLPLFGQIIFVDSKKDRHVKSKGVSSL
jgi:hypothetical protein